VSHGYMSIIHSGFGLASSPGPSLAVIGAKVKYTIKKQSGRSCS